MRRGTLRDPGPDLHRLPIGLDFTGISIAEGLRAAVATGVVLLINNAWIGSPALTLAAFAATLTCFCDTGGPVRQRVPALLSFTLLGALVWAGLGLIHGAGPWIVVPTACAIVFCNSMARVWGPRAQAVGNVLTVVLSLAADRPLGTAQAGVLFLSFVGGGAWATLLTIFIWRIHPNGPARRLLTGDWRFLAALARDLAGLLERGDVSPYEWAAHARAHRRAVRDALEETRGMVVATLRSPGPISAESARLLLGLETADRVFGALIALSDRLESAEEGPFRAASRKVLRRLRPLLTLLGQERVARPNRLERVLGDMAADAASDPALDGIVEVLIDRLRVAFRLKGEHGDPVAADVPRLDGSPKTGLWQALRSNLDWQSAILRHAVRASVLTGAAVTVSLLWWSPYSHWLTVTVALTMQPYFAATWQRALERTGGTVLGALTGGGLAFLPQDPLTTALTLVPLCILGFSVRQVSYGAYIACLTPLTVVLFEVAEPGHGAFVIAAMRTLYTVGGGVAAVLACMVLWPSWEPDRTGQELRATLRAHADYAAALFEALSIAAGWEKVEGMRRKAGVASNNLEASLSRLLQEPDRGGAGRIEAWLAADASLRRLGGGLIALQHDIHAADSVDRATWEAWRAWIPATLYALSDERALHAPKPSAPADSTLARLGRVLELLEDVVAETIGSSADAARALPPDDSVAKIPVA
jgi:uncharacterized membrane protein YccC